MVYDRYQPKHFEENAQEMCSYCRRTPASWDHVDNEKVCPHCGTRIYSPSIAQTAPSKTEARLARR
jgi:rubredoxin